MWLAPDVELEVVGESFHAGHLGRLLADGKHDLGLSLVAWLVPEPANPHDPNAVMVWLCGGQVGHLARGAAAIWQKELVALSREHQAQVACLAEIRGGQRPSVWLRVPSDSPQVPEHRGGRDGPRPAVQEATFSVDVGQFITDSATSDPEFAARLLAHAEEHERFLAGLSTEERAAYDAKLRFEQEASAREAAVLERDFELQQRAREERHRQIESDRRAGIVGTQTEVGRPHGLSAVAVGRVLDEHGLREAIPVQFAGYSEPLNLARGVPEGYAVFDDYSGRVYWIASKVTPLLADASKGRRRSKR